MIRPLKYGIFLFLAIFAINLFIFLFVLLLIKSFGLNLTISFLLGILGMIVSSGLVILIVVFGAPALKYFLFNFRRLIRLENLSNSLLLKLSSEASGTYQHSLMTANIAHKAAKAIGANALLCRISSYYHDIGKLKSPKHFIENQSPRDNIHEKIADPEKSAQIIIDHVKEGARIAKENHFPAELTEIIEQHHGTGLVTYFFKNAKAGNEPIRERRFHYSGPKPMTREAAIVMLADSLEAQIRVHPKINEEVIAKTVEKATDEKMNEGQLDLAQFMPGDIEKIKKAMIENLKSIFHHRIEY